MDNRPVDNRPEADNAKGDNAERVLVPVAEPEEFKPGFFGTFTLGLSVWAREMRRILLGGLGLAKLRCQGNVRIRQFRRQSYRQSKLNFRIFTFALDR